MNKTESKLDIAKLQKQFDKILAELKDKDIKEYAVYCDSLFYLEWKKAMREYPNPEKTK